MRREIAPSPGETPFRPLCIRVRQSATLLSTNSSRSNRPDALLVRKRINYPATTKRGVGQARSCSGRLFGSIDQIIADDARKTILSILAGARGPARRRQVQTAGRTVDGQKTGPTSIRHRYKQTNDSLE